MDLKDIKAIVDLMKKNSISEFELERQDFKVRMKRNTGSNGPYAGDDNALSHYAPQSLPRPGGSSAPAATASSQPAQEEAPATNEVEIKAPMIGTLYRAPSPESTNYIEVGAEVNPETVVCLIEAMKVMNEIKAEVKGVITQVLVENAKPVEFNQPLFKVRPT